ncbi:hypothetical protein AJ88_44240 [Mesorhizobium amorphae CCBAU 01583]|nr:hypothetical protein AJ88_44240 [Mesorhizobium amorphae CCBAU 01583]
MDMAEEDVADIAVALEQFQEARGLFEPERIEQRQAELDRRMVQEDVGLPSRRFAEPGIQPGQPLVGQLAGDAAFGQAVEEQQRRLRCLEDRLHEAIVVDRVFGKCRGEIGAPVVISRQQPVRQGKPGQGRFQIGIVAAAPVSVRSPEKTQSAASP